MSNRCLHTEGSYVGTRFGASASAKRSHAPSRGGSQASIHADASKRSQLQRGPIQAEDTEETNDKTEPETAGIANDRLFPDTAEGHMAMVCYAALVAHVSCLHIYPEQT